MKSLMVGSFVFSSWESESMLLPLLKTKACRSTRKYPKFLMNLTYKKATYINKSMDTLNLVTFSGHKLGVPFPWKQQETWPKNLCVKRKAKNQGLKPPPTRGLSTKRCRFLASTRDDAVGASPEQWKIPSKITWDPIPTDPVQEVAIELLNY